MKSVVVTGGGQGLGEGLVEAFRRRGANVLVVDRNAAAADDVASRLGGISCQADIGDHAGVLRVIETARSAFGGVDVYCSNAARAADPDFLEIDDDAWDSSFRVNVLSHMWAAKALLPGWLERGEGHLFQTVSVTALTLNHWDPAYSVSKRGALAFNEYLAVRYGHRGIGVTAFCPRGMKTPLLMTSDSPAARNAMRTAVTPSEAGEIGVRGIEEGRFLVLTEGEEIESHRAKAIDHDAWIVARRDQFLTESG